MASLSDAFERALGDILTRVSASGSSTVPDASKLNVAIAYSGGLDSSVLLHLAKRYASKHSIRLFAFHIHHGLSPNADHWLTHCEHQCARLGVRFEECHISLAQQRQRGVEEAARIARYAALGELCRVHSVHVLLTAHHQDDQAETVLLHLLRGAGVSGLGGMELFNHAPSLLGSDDLMMARPLLGVSRAALEGYANGYGIQYVEDESNVETRYARNALRHNVMETLERLFPGSRECIARTAQHAQAARRLLESVAAQDLEQCAAEKSLSIGQLRRLSDDRIDNVLRYWFATQGMRMPTAAWLVELREQLFNAREDSQLCVTHADGQIRRYRDKIYLVPRQSEEFAPLPLEFRWRGEEKIAFPDFHGSLHFEVASQGLDVNWLRQQDLVLRRRSGGERLKPSFNRPTRTLKQHYQALNIPPWQRERLPMLTTGGNLLFAAGVGIDCKYLGSLDGEKRALRWKFEED